MSKKLLACVVAGTLMLGFAAGAQANQIKLHAVTNAHLDFSADDSEGSSIFVDDLDANKTYHIGCYVDKSSTNSVTVSALSTSSATKTVTPGDYAFFDHLKPIAGTQVKNWIDIDVSMLHKTGKAKGYCILSVE